MASQTVVITGGAGNLGRAVAAAFNARGANVVVWDRPDIDLLAFESIEKATKRLGRIDVLCNIAGGFRMGSPVHETSEKDWEFLMDLNARTVVNTARAVVPRMLAAGGGKIVNIGAYAAQKGAAFMGAYVASKSAVIRLTETMAAELREKNINVNCVLPTILDTPENRKSMPGADPKRWVAPQDLAQVVVFLASDAARAIHGAAIPVTGLSGPSFDPEGGELEVMHELAQDDQRSHESLRSGGACGDSLKELLDRFAIERMIGGARHRDHRGILRPNGHVLWRRCRHARDLVLDLGDRGL